MTETRVLILAQDPLARAGLAAQLQFAPDVRVIGETAPDNPSIETFHADILLVDLGWEFDGDAVALADTPFLELEMPLLVLVPHTDAAPGVLRILQAQTIPYGVLHRASTPTLLNSALTAVPLGLIVLDPSMMQPLNNPNPALGLPLEHLTPREHEVLLLLAEGLPNKTIARQLHISEYTVKFHVNAILNKLDAGSRTEAVVRATRLGLIAL